MDTTTTTHTLRRLTAAPGHWLIARADLDAARATSPDDTGAGAPYMTRTIYLGSADTPDRYAEITDAARDEILAKFERKEDNPETPADI